MEKDQERLVIETLTKVAKQFNVTSIALSKVVNEFSRTLVEFTKAVDTPEIRKILNEMNNDAVQLEGQPLCSVCGLPQYETQSGMICDNGHGGAESIYDR